MKSLRLRNLARDEQVEISLEPGKNVKRWQGEILQVKRTSCFFISSDVGFPSCYETERISNVEILPTETDLLLVVELLLDLVSAKGGKGQRRTIIFSTIPLNRLLI